MRRTSFMTFVVVALAATACGPVRLYDARPALPLSDAKLSGAAPVISYRSVALDPKVVVDDKTSGPRVERFIKEWPSIGASFNEAFLEPEDEGLRFVSNDPSAPYVLTAEVIRVDSGEDMSMWTGQWTTTFVLLTLWDQPQKKVLDRFTIRAAEAGSWNAEAAGETAVTKAREYLAARFGGKAVDQ
ncbi:MAG: hypothetical protein HOV80_32175 [Polyangiaceae bacterium]|nr:hypothetical protein [Polyangiaceae bacterium]